MPAPACPRGHHRPFATPGPLHPLGTHTLTAVAIDDDGARTTSSAVPVSVSAPNPPPTVALSAPANGASSRSAHRLRSPPPPAIADGTVARVEFFAGASLLGADASAPFGYSWATAPVGPHTLTAVAVDDKGARTTSGAVTIAVNAASGAGQTVTLQDGLNGYAGRGMRSFPRTHRRPIPA